MALGAGMSCFVFPGETAIYTFCLNGVRGGGELNGVPGGQNAKCYLDGVRGGGRGGVI